MERGLELVAKALAVERVATGGLAVMVPSRAIGGLTTSRSDSEMSRYLARLLGIRQVVLGVLLWRSQDDRAWLRRLATLNALTELLDAAVTLVHVVQRRGGRPKAAVIGAALSAAAAFLALHAAAS